MSQEWKHVLAWVGLAVALAWWGVMFGWIVAQTMGLWREQRDRIR